MIKGLELLCYEVRLEELGLFITKTRRLQEDLTVTFQYLKEAYRRAGEGLFMRICSDRIRGNKFKLEECGLVNLGEGKCWFVRVWVTVLHTKQWGIKSASSQKVNAQVLTQE